MRSLEVLESRCLLAVTLTGRVFEDANGNQQWETGGPAGERPLACWEVFLDVNLDGARQQTEPSARSGSDGMYRFEGLEAGTYRVELAAEPGFDRTTPVQFAGPTSLVAAIPQDQVLDPVRNVLYVTSGDRILRRDPLTGATLASLAIGQSLSGIDVTPDGRYLIVGDAALDAGNATGRLHRIDLTDNSVVSIPFSIASDDERGVFDVVAVGNARVLFTTRSLSNDAVPLREADLSSGTVAERKDILSRGAGLVHPASRLDRNVAGQAVVLVEAGDAAGRVYQFDPQASTFSNPVSLHARLDDAHVAISRDGQRVAIEAASLGLKVLDPQGNVVHSLPHLRGGVAFDTHRDILYAGDTTSNELVAFRVGDWSELYRTPLGEDVPDSGNYFEMHVGSRARVLSVSTPAGVRYVRLDQAVPHVVHAAADSVFSLLDFGVWWNGQNRRPEGTADAYLVDEDTERQVGGAGVLANDSDTDGDALTATMADPPLHGTVDFHSDGTFVYRPAENYYGSDTFTYTVHDPVLAAACRTTVTLQVTPVNDAPVAIALDHASVRENSTAAVIGLVTVTDPDVGDQHVLTVSDPRFEVVNGMLKLRSLQSLDHELAAVIPITITATDHGVPARHFSRDFTIAVEDVNEFDPDIQTSTIEVDEGSASAGSVVVQDGDTSQSILISILGGNGLGVFSIDPQTGQIVVADGQTLDHEGTRTYVLTLQATDNAQPPRTTTKDITITVLDVNEADPQVTPAEFTLAEDAPVGAVVGAVIAQDADTRQSLHYAITAGNPGNAFAIDGTTGEITVATPSVLDFETSDTIEFTVTVTDSGTPVRSGSAQVTVRLTDVNEFTPVISPQVFSVDEEAASGTVVGIVAATDGDVAQSRKFAIVGNNSSFAINSQTGQITVADGYSLDYETRVSVSLDVQVTDNGVPARSSTATITVQLRDVNEFAPELLDTTLQVPENAVSLGKIMALDGDIRQSLTYSLLDDPDSLFTIDASTGEVSVRSGKALDYEQATVHTATVQVKDSGNPAFTASASLLVQVSDVNEFAPEATDQVFVVPENAPAGWLVGIIEALDQDRFQTLNYAVISGNEQGAFLLESASGEIRVAGGAPLDAEVNSRFDWTVAIWDDGTPTRETIIQVTILVGDQNEFPPELEDTIASVVENAPSGAVVTQLVAVDPDPIRHHVFSVVGGTGANLFTVSASGEVRVAEGTNLDFESQASYELEVRVTEGGPAGGTDTAILVIELLDQNEFAPVAQDVEVQIVENTSVGNLVGRVQATDGDTAQAIHYEIVDGNASEVFQINPDTGEVTVLQSAALDFESTQVFVLNVRATDNGSPAQSSTSSVRIILQDSNETAPVVENQSFVIVENALLGSILGQIVASDGDLFQNLRYAIISGNSGNAFEIDPNNGELFVGQETLDFETRPRYQLTVRVTDDGSPARSDTAIITIDILNDNDAPHDINLSGTTLRAGIAGALVGIVTVQDQDLSDQHAFAVNDERFEINTRRELKLRDGIAVDNGESQIQIEITATDLGGLSYSEPFILVVSDGAAVWQNARDPRDVNNDGSVTPQDALVIINEINNPQHSEPNGRLFVPRPDIPGLPYYDVNGDGFVTAIDVLIIINRLNESAAESSSGEGEGPTPAGEGYGAVSPPSLPGYAVVMADEPPPAAAPLVFQQSMADSDRGDMSPLGWPQEVVVQRPSSLAERVEKSPRESAAAPALRSWQAMWVEEGSLAAEPRGTIDESRTGASRLDEDFAGPLSDWLDLDQILSEIAEEQGSARGR